MADTDFLMTLTIGAYRQLLRDELKPLAALAVTGGKLPAVGDIVHTPFGDYKVGDTTPAGTVVPPASNPLKQYFKENAPSVYRTDPTSLKIFSQIYGQKALGILTIIGHVPENIDPTVVTTKYDLAKITDDGKIAYVTASNLLNMEGASWSDYVGATFAAVQKAMADGTMDTTIFWRVGVTPFTLPT